MIDILNLKLAVISKKRQNVQNYKVLIINLEAVIRYEK